MVSLIVRISAISLALFFFSAPHPDDQWQAFAESGDLTGFSAPSFSLPDMDGKVVSLQAFRGKVILLNFWTTWCPPCRQEIPDLNDLQDRLRSRGFVIVAVSTDISGKTLQDFLRKHRVSYIVLHDQESKVARQYKAYSLPASFLIDRDGRIVERFTGSEDWTGQEFLRKVERLL